MQLHSAHFSPAAVAAEPGGTLARSSNRVVIVSPHRQLSLGVIGIGSDWESSYRPALERLGSRVRIDAAGGPVAKTAIALAEDLGAVHMPGVRGLLKIEMDGVLAIAPESYGWFPVEAAVTEGRNIYVCLPERWDARQLSRLLRSAQANGLLIMPELRLRYTPATLRLRELLATDLGPIEQIQIHTLSRDAPSTQRLLRELLDWCRTVVGGGPATIQATQEDHGSLTTQTVSAVFPAMPGRHGEFIATIVVPAASHEMIQTYKPREAERIIDERGRHTIPSGDATALQPSTAADVWPVEFSLTCKYGEVRLENAVHLRWRTGGQERVESLSTERTAISVALDHFARRLAGGLVPVPTLADLIAAEHEVNLAAQSLAQGGRALPTH
ncbi:MAG: hypothetical protein ACK5Q5_09655 [Planctomycetaceae bacterium]